MITLTLLHPNQSIPVKSWSFETESVIQIGRSADNHVVLYSAVVSRHHVEVRQEGDGWAVVNLGTNGTYLDDRPIAHKKVADGTIVRLARSGPRIQINFESAPPKPLSQAQQLLRSLIDRATDSEDSTTADRTAPGPTLLPPEEEPSRRS